MPGFAGPPVPGPKNDQIARLVVSAQNAGTKTHDARHRATKRANDKDPGPKQRFLALLARTKKLFRAR